MLSVVVPAYNEEQMLPIAARAIHDCLAQNDIPHELIFVDDGSADGTWSAIERIRTDGGTWVRGLRFSRNFGKEAAIFAGLEACRGDCCVVMDCDLQHPPELIPRMYGLWQAGYEVVEGVKASRGKESAVHALSARVFYAAIGKLAHLDMEKASDFKLLDRKAINALLRFPENQAFFRALSSWVGFRKTTVEFHVRPREAGVSKWSVGALFRYALVNITAFSAAPMQVVTAAGLLFFAFSIVLGIQSMVRYLTGGAVEGFTTVILLQLLIGSVIMLSLGVMGYYMQRMYDELKRRPRYLVTENLDNER
jgi:glycosyltransferase involved in cell wall biosynthesis